MRDIINATIGTDHFLKCSTYALARNGEGLTPCLSITIPDGLLDYWAYIDFKKPNGETFKTPRIDVDEGKIIYNIPCGVLDTEGKLEVQVVFQNADNEIWKTYVKEFAVRYSINATDDIPDKQDFIAEAQKLLDELNENGVGKRQPEGGEIFNDYENNVAGAKAFLVNAINSNSTTITLDTTDGLAVGYICSLNSGSNYDFFGTITNINGNSVTFDKLPKNVSLKEGATLWVPEHPELGTQSIGLYSHAEGLSNIASAIGAHAEGGYNVAGGKYSHAEGRNNKAGYASHAEGVNNEAIGLYSHAEGGSNKALEQYSHVEGYNNEAVGTMSHAEGINNKAVGSNSHAEGETTETLGASSHAEGKSTLADGVGAHAEGWGSKSTGHGSHAENYSKAQGDYSHSEGYDTNAENNYSHSEGKLTSAKGVASHAEGENTVASGTNSHAEGKGGVASGSNSHTEGTGCKASGTASHAEGWGSEASGEGAHAENYSKAQGRYSHSGGYGTVAGYEYQNVTGIYNKNEESNLFEVGNGASDTKRSNAFAVKKDGSMVIGGVTITPTQLTKLLALIGE